MFDAKVDRTYISRLERCSENLTVTVLERLASALASNIVDLFGFPESDAEQPQRLKSGPKPGESAPERPNMCRESPNAQD